MKIPFPIKVRNKLTPTRIILLSFILLILVGTMLLMLPIAHKSTESVSFLDALFTATSASCVTGLVVKDTNSFWTIFGKSVILILIQIGGLGVMSLFTLYVLISKRHMNLKERLTLQASTNNFTLSGSFRLFLKILIVTLCFELLGAAVLFTQFNPIFGPLDSIWKSIFHSVSAFCNAGFDVFGTENYKFQSLALLSNNPITLITFSALIVIGGLGFVVWKDIWDNKFKIRRYSLHSKIVIISTLILILGGTFLFFCLENRNPNTIGPMSPTNKIVNSLFQSITPRTAGFSSINPKDMTQQSNFFTIILMLIGAAPGSTGGGIKVTTISVLILASIFFIMGRKDIQVMKNTIPEQIIYRAVCIFMLAILLLFIGTGILLIRNPNLSFLDVFFETASAISTSGLSTGITPSLDSISKIVLIILMFLGRLGPLTAIIAFSRNQLLSESPYRYSDGKIAVG
jgi:trk system potassium uptake protein TrkH